MRGLQRIRARDAACIIRQHGNAIDSCCSLWRDGIRLPAGADRLYIGSIDLPLGRRGGGDEPRHVVDAKSFQGLSS